MKLEHIVAGALILIVAGLFVLVGPPSVAGRNGTVSDFRNDSSDLRDDTILDLQGAEDSVPYNTTPAATAIPATEPPPATAAPPETTAPTTAPPPITTAPPPATTVPTTPPATEPPPATTTAELDSRDAQERVPYTPATTAPPPPATTVPPPPEQIEEPPEEPAPVIVPPSADSQRWIHEGSGLVAHAGGTTSGRRAHGTNSREAVFWSYEHGHRVFEMDFRLTTDNRLAAVHSWEGWGGRMSSYEWNEAQIWRVFTSMMLECMLEIMLARPDIFLITDTKSYQYTREEAELQFRILADAALRLDPTGALLDRVIPQIYNQEMLELVMAVHPFPSIIYTLYASRDSDAQVIDFVRRHANIGVVTMTPARGTPEFIQALADVGRAVYFHTVNELGEMLEYRERGAHGFYTTFILPGDF